MLKPYLHHLSWLFPDYCAGCGELTRGHDWCVPCEVTLTPTRQPKRVDQELIGLWAYGAALQQALARWKNSGSSYLVHPLKALWLSLALPLAQTYEPDLIVAIPSSKSALWKRGFNPAGLLAQALSGALKAPFRSDCLVLQKRITSAKGMTRTARLNRLNGAFKAHDVQAKRVILVDDVLTTGATLRDARRALIDAHAASVLALAFAQVEDN